MIIIMIIYTIVIVIYIVVVVMITLVIIMLIMIAIVIYMIVTMLEPLGAPRSTSSNTKKSGCVLFNQQLEAELHK